MMEKDKLSRFIEKIEELTKKPEKYLSFEKKQVNFLKILTKHLYDFTKEKEYPKNRDVEVLNKLIISGLDAEQVWQQIELQNNSVYDKLVSEIAYLSAKKDSLKFPLKEKREEINVSKYVIKNTATEDKLKKKVVVKASPKWQSSVVDDKFFKLYEMENFLETIEKKEGKKVTDDAEEEQSEDDLSSIDDEDNEKQYYYNDFFDQPEEKLSSENSEIGDEDNDDNRKNKVKFMLNGKQNEEKSNDNVENLNENDSLDDFEDFNEGNNLSDVNAELSTDDDNNDDNADNDVDDYEEVSNDATYINNDNDDEDIEDDDVERENAFTQPSTFEARQERIKSRIKNLEEEALEEKPWQLKGEVTASSRPQNSLLEEYVEFDIAARPAPVLTEKSTLKLEDVILQRIKDAAWDDVVRKIKPIENDIEYKKKLVLNQEKSKLSLAQIYENEYLKQLENKNDEMIDKPEKELPEHQEIRIMMNNLFSKLDALSNFHFTPKLVAPEVKIISNLPAINMEEVAPVATSDAALLAPEEIKPKLKGDLLGKSERTKTDKNREKRKQKLKQKLKFKQMEAKTKLKLDDSDTKNSQKKISQKFLQKITKSSNITQLSETDDGKSVKSSNAFFSKLQNETKSLTKKKGFDVKKKKLNKKIKSAAR